MSVMHQKCPRRVAERRTATKYHLPEDDGYHPRSQPPLLLAGHRPGPPTSRRAGRRPSLTLQSGSPGLGQGTPRRVSRPGRRTSSLYEDCGVKDFDVWLFYALPPERQASHFPWNRNVVHVDFGPSAHGRQEYTSDEWANPGYNVAQWDTFTGRRVDLLARAILSHAEGPRAAVRDWLRRGLRHRPQRGKGRPSAWWLAQKPVIDLAATKLGETWWDPRSTDLPAAD